MNKIIGSFFDRRVGTLAEKFYIFNQSYPACLIVVIEKVLPF